MELPHLERFDKLYCETKRQEYMFLWVNPTFKLLYLALIDPITKQRGARTAYKFHEFDWEFLMKKWDWHKEAYNLIKDWNALFTYN